MHFSSLEPITFILTCNISTKKGGGGL